MINWETYRLEYRGRVWSYQDIVRETEMDPTTIKRKIRKYLDGKTKLRQVFKKKPPPLKLKKKGRVTADDIMKITGADRRLANYRIFRFRQGKISENQLLKPKFKQGQNGKISDFWGASDKLPPDRQAAWEEMNRKANSPPYLRQEELMPTRDTPIFREASR